MQLYKSAYAVDWNDAALTYTTVVGYSIVYNMDHYQKDLHIQARIRQILGNKAKLEIWDAGQYTLTEHDSLFEADKAAVDALTKAGHELFVGKGFNSDDYPLKSVLPYTTICQDLDRHFMSTPPRTAMDGSKYPPKKMIHRWVNGVACTPA
jgi:hypothetical protein